MQPQLAPMARSSRRSGGDPMVFTIVGAGMAFVLINAMWAAAAFVSEPLPSHFDVLGAYPDLITGDLDPTDETLPAAIGASMINFAIAVVLGAVAGIGLGALSRSHALLRSIVDPLASFLRIAAFVGLPQVLLASRGLERSFQVIPPAVVVASTLALAIGRARGDDGTSVAIMGVRNALALGWGSLMFVELFGARSGLAQIAQRSLTFFQLDAMVAVALVAIAIPFVVDLAIRGIGRLVVEN